MFLHEGITWRPDVLRFSPSSLSLNLRAHVVYITTASDNLSVSVGLQYSGEFVFFCFVLISGKEWTKTNGQVLCLNQMFKSFSFSGLSLHSCKIGQQEGITSSQTSGTNTAVLILATAHVASVLYFLMYLISSLNWLTF